MNPATSPARDAYRVAVIIGSTRPARICPGIAHWTREALSEDSPLRYDVMTSPTSTFRSSTSRSSPRCTTTSTSTPRRGAA